MHDITLHALPGDGDGLGNCMQTNVSGIANVSTIKTDAVLIKPVGGTLAMQTNVDTLKEDPGPAKEKELGPAKEELGPSKEEEPGPAKEEEPGPAKEEELGPAKEEEPGPAKEEPGAGAALADGAEDKVQVVITEDKVAGAEQARRPSLHPNRSRLGARLGATG